MKIHGICLIKNERDILRYFMEQSFKWCDAIYLFDNGSTDGTWQLAQELTARYPALIPFKTTDAPFRDELRADVFNAFRDRASNGDWWCRLDADEIYIDSPREFLTGVPSSHHVVWSAHLQYYFTEVDLQRVPDSGPAPEINENNLPRFYKANASEARFFRYRERMEWNIGAWPRHMGVVHPRRIRLKHFQYRSPAQIRSRLQTRREATAKGYQHFGHSRQMDWKEQLASSGNLSLDRGDQEYVIEESALPRHMETWSIRTLKRLMHGLHLWP